MKLTPEDIIANNRYRLLLSLQYRDVAEFVISQLKSLNPVTILFYGLSATALAVALSIRLSLSDDWSLFRVLPRSLAGLILFPALIIPVHEALHVVIFRVLGGKNIRVGADIPNFIFYVTAHRHVVKPYQFLTIALFPFVVINSSLFLGVWYSPGIWKWILSLVLLVHTTMCAGDFAMAAFYYINREKKILTWDDAEKKIAYFYEDTNMAR